MELSGFRTRFMALIGRRYRELPMGVSRDEIDAALAELKAQKCGEFATPCYEVCNEHFRIGRRKFRLCTEDEMFVSLWGPKDLVDEVYARVTGKLEARRLRAVG